VAVTVTGWAGVATTVGFAAVVGFGSSAEARVVAAIPNAKTSANRVIMLPPET
jgi:hypothetical protein